MRSTEEKLLEERFDARIDAGDFIEAKELNYNMGNAVKYISRAEHKGNKQQDLEKAVWYLNRELAKA